MSDTTTEPPLLAPSSVPRPALMARLDAASKLRLAVVAAPAGAGKTTLLTQWFRRSRQRRTAAWLTLAGPLQPEALAERLLASLAAASPELVAPGADPSAQTLHAVLAQRSGDLLIVIDDIHRAQDTPCLRLLDGLLAASAPGVHWVLAGRCLPALNLPSWRLRDQLEVLDGDDLAFDAAQVLQLGRKLVTEPLSRAQAERLLDTTQGWTAGVKLGLLAVAARPREIDAALADFDGGHVDMSAYLEREVLREQDESLQDFLLGTAVVDTLTGELCDALLGRDGAQAVLERLERAQLFVTAQDSHGLAFRYHPLFHGFLRSRLAADPARQRRLHERASRWYAAQGRFAEALAHAFTSGQMAWCAELVERAALRWQQSGDIAEVVQWSERLPPEQLHARPALGVAYTTCLILCRRFDQARAMLRRMDEDAAAPAYHRRTLQQMIQAMSGDHEALGDEPPLPDETDVDAQLRGLQLVNRAYAMFCVGRFDPAWRLAMRAREVLQPISPYGDGYASSVLALVERAKGDFGSASRRVEQLWAGLRNGPRNAAWANAATALAVVRYETNRLPEARVLCEELLPLVEAGGTYETLAASARTLSRVRAAEREHEAAMRLLDYLHGVVEGSHEKRLAAQVCFDKVRLWLAMGEVARARGCLAEFDALDATEWQHARPYDEAWERRGLSLAALLAHEQRHAETQAVLQVLRESAEAAGHVLRLHAVEAALASSLWEAGARDEALQCLQQSLIRARGHAPSRSWFDDNPRFHQVLIAALDVPPLRRLMPERVLRVFGGALGRSEPRQAPAAAHAVDALTARELEVLVLIAQGLNNQQISARAQISLTTVKWHVKNIFAKLGVGTRVGALVRARELKLV
ncbi:MAG TPA: LuxR C-terminal-related transcriptional regulator [Rhizobacter sp.]|nr:LuxR C-terminal-related transcriptional regulator [Rhizobacter sp.]